MKSKPKSHLLAQKPDHSRRTFLKSTTSAVTVAALSGQPLVPHADSKKVRLGVVGGRFGAKFHWHQHPNCIVEAVSDLRPERRRHLKETYRCDKAYNSLQELVKDGRVDAVAVFTDGPLHVQHTVEAMRHGKHVISAVPACWGSLEQAELLLDTVKKYGLCYMMAETGYYQQSTISARAYYREGRFGDLYYCQAEYQHPGLENLYVENGRRTWRYGMAPMHYPTHTTSQLISVTGERLTEVTCCGWGDDSPILKTNNYGNPFWNESAMFKTDRGHAFRANIWWKGAHRGTERAEWVGDRMSFYMADPKGLEPVLVHSDDENETDDAGFVRHRAQMEQYEVPDWWATELLPPSLRHPSGHEGSHTFLTHEFISAVLHERRPVIDVYEALAYTVPGIVAHQSALRGGEQMKIPQYAAS